KLGGDMPLESDPPRASTAGNGQPVRRQKKFQLVTAVWGEWYVDAFLNANVPSLLAPGNIPDLCAFQRGRDVIFTRRSDENCIAKSAAFARLSRCLPVELVALDDRFFEGNPHVIHVDLWARAARNAAIQGEWIAFIAPDTIYADGALRQLSDQFA